MKILILNAGDHYTLGWSYKRGFESLGHDVRIIDPVQCLKQYVGWNNRFTRRLFERQIISAFNRRWLPELLEIPADLVWIGKGAWAVPWLWRKFKERRPDVKLVCFNGDNPLVTYSRGGNRPWVTESISCFDLFCTYNSCLLEPLIEAGARRVACIPFAWDPEIHPMHQYGNFERDVLFIGNGDTYRARWLTDILSHPSAKNWKVSIYGVWRKRLCESFSDVVHHQQVLGREMAKLVASSRITLNILRVQNEGSHNMRTFETPGCGGLLASQYSDEQATLLVPGEAAILFHDKYDAVQRISDALATPDYCEDLARVSHHAVRKHMYRHRAQRILQLSGVN